MKTLDEGEVPVREVQINEVVSAHIDTEDQEAQDELDASQEDPLLLPSDAANEAIIDPYAPPIPPNYEREHPVYGPTVKESLYRFANDTGASVTRMKDGTNHFHYLGFDGMEITNYHVIAKCSFDSEALVQRHLRQLQSAANKKEI